MSRKGSEVRSQWLFKVKTSKYHVVYNEKNTLYLCGCIKSLALEEKLVPQCTAIVGFSGRVKCS